MLLDPFHPPPEHIGVSRRITREMSAHRISVELYFHTVVFEGVVGDGVHVRVPTKAAVCAHTAERPSTVLLTNGLARRFT